MPLFVLDRRERFAGVDALLDVCMAVGVAGIVSWAPE